MSEFSNVGRFGTIRLQIEKSSSFDLPYVVMNVLATIVSCYGLFANSPAVVIGAMILALLLGPITGIALSLVSADFKLLRKASIAVAAGVLVVLVTAFIVGTVHADLPLTNEIESRTTPTFLDLMIALAAGGAGAYATISPRLSVAFVGVAIATALVPPLSVCGILLARGDYSSASGAFLLAFTNIVAIEFSASVVMWLSGIRERGNRWLLLPRIVSLAVILVLAGELVRNLHNLIETATYNARVEKILADDLATYSGAYLVGVQISRREADNTTIVRAVMRGPYDFDSRQIAAMEDDLPQPPDGSKLELRLREVKTIVMTRNGQLFSPHEAAKDALDVRK